MAIVQDAYDITDDIMLKILSGEYRRIGSVVRYAKGSKKGQIVKHLDPVNLPEADTQGLAAKVLQFANNNKKMLIGAGIGLAVIIGTGIYIKVKKSKEPAEVVKFRASLKIYLNAVRKGTLTMEILNDLIACLDELKRCSNYEKISIELFTEELDTLVNRLFDYTKKLAADNAVELTNSEKEEPSTSEQSITDLRRYLEAQKRIFEVAA